MPGLRAWRLDRVIGAINAEQEARRAIGMQGRCNDKEGKREVEMHQAVAAGTLTRLVHGVCQMAAQRSFVGRHRVLALRLDVVDEGQGDRLIALGQLTKVLVRGHDLAIRLDLELGGLADKREAFVRDRPGDQRAHGCARAEAVRR